MDYVEDDDITEVITLDVDSDPEEMSNTPIQKRKRRAVNGGSTSETAAAMLATQEITISLSKETLINRVTAFIIEDLHPITIINDIGFQKLLKLLQMESLLPNIESILTNVDYLYDIEISKVKDVLKNVSAISLSIEQWHTISEDKYITITANYIDDEWTPRSNVLATKKVCEPESNGIYNKLIETVRCFEIENKIVSIVCNNTKLEYTPQNLPSTSKNYNFGANISCFVSKLQSCIDQCLNSIFEVHNTLEKCKALVSYFQHSEEAASFLRSYQKFLEVAVDSLAEYNPNEINSVYLMLEKLIKQKTPINSVMADHDVIDPVAALSLNLTENEWIIAEGVVEILKPFQLTKLVIFPENGQDASVSMVKPLVDSLCKNFFIHDGRKDSIGTRINNNIKQNLLCAFKMYDANTAEIKRADYIDIATYLDPRYKNQDYLDVRQQEVIRIDIKERLFKRNESDNDVASSSSSSSNVQINDGDTSKKRSRQAKALDLLFPTVSKKNVPSISEWTAYVGIPEIDKSSNIYEWWKSNARTYPELSKAAKSYLCTPAIAKKNYASHNTQMRRACLPPQYIDKLIFLNNKLY